MTSRPGPDVPADDTDSIARLYALTDGRTRPRHTLSMHTVLGAGPRSPQGVPEESVQIIELCRQRSRPLVELAGMLGLHVAAVSVLVSDLIDAGALSLPIPETPGKARDRQQLLALSAALRRQWPRAKAKAG
ncbi:DUF742 domain-containing protein [Streptomyces sp. NPDC001536]|uniref:DUF742 domain-containing protein n=1 Tax=Streptomyces sp. NPDC001536 TaxID=3364583 RepID=UPI0036803D7D